MRTVTIYNLKHTDNEHIEKTLKAHFADLIRNRKPIINGCRKAGDWRLDFEIELKLICRGKKQEASQDKVAAVAVEDVGCLWPPPPPSELLKEPEGDSGDSTGEDSDSGLTFGDVTETSKLALRKARLYVKAARVMLGEAYDIQKPLDGLAVVELAKVIESIEYDIADQERYELPTSLEKFLMNLEKDDLKRLAKLLAPLILQFDEL